MFSEVQNSYFLSVPASGCAIPRSQRLLEVHDKRADKTYLCKMRVSKQQRFVAVGTAVSVDERASAEKSIQLFEDAVMIVRELVESDSKQKPLLIFQNRVVEQSYLQGLPYAPLCTVRLQFCQFQVQAKQYGVLDEYDTEFGCFARSKAHVSINKLVLDGAAFFGDFSAMHQLQNYIELPCGGASLTGGSGKDSLIDFLVNYNGLRARDFQLCGKPQNQSKSLLDYYNQFLFYKRQTPQSSAIEDVFGDLVGASFDTLVFRDIQFKVRSLDQSEEQNQLTSSLIKAMDDNQAKIYQQKLRYKLIATAEDLDQIDPALRRSGRFGTEIRLPYLNFEIRRRYVVLMLFGDRDLASGPEIADLAEFEQKCSLVEAQIASKIDPRALNAAVEAANGLKLRDLVAAAKATLSINENNTTAVLQQFCSELKKYQNQTALEMIEQNNLELFSTSNSISNKMTQIVGVQSQAKLLLQNFALISSPLAIQLKLEPQNCILFGDSGTGKTLLTQLLKNHTQMPVFRVDSTQIYSQYVGESEQNVIKVFRKARESAPAIIVFEQIDALVGQKRGKGDDGGSNVSERVLAQFLTEMDGVSNVDTQIYCVGTSQTHPSELDSAITRPGRFGLKIECTNIPAEEANQFLKWCGSDQTVSDDIAGCELMQMVE